MAANLLVALSAAGGGGWREQAASSALGRPTGESGPLSPHRLITHHINVTIRQVTRTAVALEAASQDQATASPRLSPDDALAQRNGSCRFEAGVDYDRGGGGRAHATGVASKEACCALCKERPSCGVATYLAASQQCWFKPLDATRRPSKSGAGVVSCVLWALEANGDDSTRVIPDDRKDAEMNKEKESLPFASSAGNALSPRSTPAVIDVTPKPLALAVISNGGANGVGNGTGPQIPSTNEPPLLSSAWLSTRHAVVLDKHRALNQTRHFSFVHISKAGGATFIQWACHHRELFPRFYPTHPVGAEHGFLFDRRKRPQSQRLVLLRSPRAHLLSMFKECRYDAWGRKLIHQSKSYIPHSGSHQHDFEQWVDYYMHPLGKRWQGCYEPWNYQARAMTSGQECPHSVSLHDADYEPSFDAAMASYLEADWVGLTDFYDESLCLMLSRLQSARAAALFSTTCGCDNKASVLDVKVVTHGDVDSTAVDVHPILAVKMDRLTAVDKALFSVALRGFFREITDLEARVARRIMCPDVLQRMEPKLLYITSVTALYNASRR